MTTLFRSIVLLVAASALGGCDISDPVWCDLPVPPYALFVGVRDSVTDRPLARGTIGTADAVGVHDTLITFGGDSTTLDWCTTPRAPTESCYTGWAIAIGSPKV